MSQLLNCPHSCAVVHSHAQQKRLYVRRTVQCSARGSDTDSSSAACGCLPHHRLLPALLAAAVVATALPAIAAPRLPPIDSDPNRCERAYTGNTLGMANAVSDKLIDLRNCKYPGKNLADKVLSGALVSGADFSNSVMTNVTLTKAYAVGANFSGADLTNAVLDRVDFTDSDFRKAKFVNAVVTGANFKGANLAEAIFEDALIGSEDFKQLCQNPTVTGETRIEIGCRT